MKTKLTYTIETIDRAFGGRVPWEQARRLEGLTASKAIKTFKAYYRDYHPEGSNGWTGHVRIVGSDDWTYMVEPPAPGARATLQAMYHLDDI